MTIVRITTIAELESHSNFVDLVNEYAAEARIAEMPMHDPDMNRYKALESAGMLAVLGAYDDDKLVGFVVVLLTPVPHYGDAIVGSTESYFVAQSHRKSGAGLKLLRAAEAEATQRGACIMFVSAPMEGRLVQVMPSFGYRESNRVFCRSLT